MECYLDGVLHVLNAQFIGLTTDWSECYLDGVLYVLNAQFIGLTTDWSVTLMAFCMS